MSQGTGGGMAAGTDRAERQTNAGTALGVALLVGAAVAVSTGVYARVHEPAGRPLFTLGFSGMLPMKAWLTTAAAVLLLVQLATALWMWGRLPGAGPAPGWAAAPMERDDRVRPHPASGLPLHLGAGLCQRWHPGAPPQPPGLRLLRGLHGKDDQSTDQRVTGAGTARARLDGSCSPGHNLVDGFTVVFHPVRYSARLNRIPRKKS